MFNGFTGNTCRCTFTVCQCHTQTITTMTAHVIASTSSIEFVPEPPRKNQQHYSQFNRGAYGTTRKKR